MLAAHNFLCTPSRLKLMYLTSQSRGYITYQPADVKRNVFDQWSMKLISNVFRQLQESWPETMTSHHLEMSGPLNALLLNLLSSSDEDFQVGDGASDGSVLI